MPWRGKDEQAEEERLHWWWCCYKDSANEPKCVPKKRRKGWWWSWRWKVSANSAKHRTKQEGKQFSQRGKVFPTQQLYWFMAWPSNVTTGQDGTYRFRGRRLFNCRFGEVLGAILYWTEGKIIISEKNSTLTAGWNAFSLQHRDTAFIIINMTACQGVESRLVQDMIVLTRGKDLQRMRFK